MRARLAKLSDAFCTSRQRHLGQRERLAEYRNRSRPETRGQSPERYMSSTRDMDGELPTKANMRHLTRYLGGSGKTARSILERWILESGARLSWQLFYGPDDTALMIKGMAGESLNPPPAIPPMAVVP